MGLMDDGGMCAPPSIGGGPGGGDLGDDDSWQ